MNSKIFQRWVDEIFDHPVVPGETERHWDDDSEPPTAEQRVVSLTRLFSTPASWSRFFTDDQLAVGLSYLVSDSCSSYCHDLIQGPVPWQLRRAAVDSIKTLFSDLFAVRCSQHLSHMQPSGAGRLNGVCYMWWDLFPTWGRPQDPRQRPLDELVLRTMESILGSDHLACIESALHGLGHWHLHYPAEVEDIIGRRQKSLRALSQLYDYAECAKKGRVQ